MSMTAPEAPAPGDVLPGRDRFIDFLRAFSLLVVVVWHTVFTILVWRDDGPHATSPLGFFGGDPAGFPNGRRVGDDVLDIDLKAAAGAILHILGAINCPISVQLSDNVQQNDVPYLTTFPYLGLPHEGYRHAHDHD